MSPVEEFLLEQPENLKPLIKKLHELIISASPYINDRLVYGIPFYYGKKRIFYITPQKSSVDLGFCEGYLLSENQILETKNRTKVKTIRFNSIDEIEEEIVLPHIHEAIIIDDIRNKKKK